MYQTASEIRFIWKQVGTVTKNFPFIKYTSPIFDTKLNVNCRLQTEKPIGIKSTFH
jgi:hypothetical protein